MVLGVLLFRKGDTKKWLEAISKVDSSYFQTFSCIYVFTLISTFSQKFRIARSPSWGKHWSWKYSKRQLKVVWIECENANSKRIHPFGDPKNHQKNDISAKPERSRLVSIMKHWSWNSTELLMLQILVIQKSGIPKRIQDIREKMSFTQNSCVYFRPAKNLN